jgi:glycosyltransferase involved in cell wall biosynthesis
VRVLVFHGYLLHGTGSNVYNASLARALVEGGHEVHILCQDRAAEELPFVDAVGDWVDGRLEVRTLREPVRCTAYRPDIGRILPVYVADEYEAFTAVPYPQLDDVAVQRYVAVNAAAVDDVVRRAHPDAALANHLVMGPVILARGLAGRVPYAVKVHGSALEYTVKPHRDRFLSYAREGLGPAKAVLVGSRHTAESLWAAMDDDRLPARTRLGPPGVDVDAFRPRSPTEAANGLRALADRVERGGSSGWGADAGAASALRMLDPATESIVLYVGKLIVSKGVDLLLAAWPLVVASAPDARLCVVGFGTYRAGLERLSAALAGGDLSPAWDVALRGRELEGGPRAPLRHLTAFLDRLEAGRLGGPGADAAGYLRAAPRAFDQVHLTGALAHADLPDLISACSAQVVPSTFPEAFGMVAAEAASCGVLPISAAHSGLAEVSATLAPALEPDLRPLLDFEVGDGAVEAIAERILGWLGTDSARRARASAALSETARERYGWDQVASSVLAAATGRTDELPAPTGAPGAGTADPPSG